MRPDSPRPAIRPPPARSDIDDRVRVPRQRPAAGVIVQRTGQHGRRAGRPRGAARRRSRSPDVRRRRSLRGAPAGLAAAWRRSATVAPVAARRRSSGRSASSRGRKAGSAARTRRAAARRRPAGVTDSLVGGGRHDPRCAPAQAEIALDRAGSPQRAGDVGLRDGLRAPGRGSAPSTRRWWPRRCLQRPGHRRGHRRAVRPPSVRRRGSHHAPTTRTVGPVRAPCRR